MKKKKLIIIILIILFLIVGGGIFAYFKFFQKEEVTTTTNEVVITNTIEEYGYNLEDRDTALFEELFNELKNILNEEEIDKDGYAKLISELFIVDLYTIDNKLSKYDIGGVEYMYSSAVDSFKSVVMSSIYKTVENNLDGTRTQSLPIVSEISVDSITTTSYELPDETVLSGYKVYLNWSYETNLGYDNEGYVIVVPENEKLCIISYEPTD